MTTQVQFRRGTTAEHNTFTGALGEITVDTTLKTLKVHDGATAGGTRIAKFGDIAASTITFSDSASSSITVTPGSSDIVFVGSSITPTVTGNTVTITLDKTIDVDTIQSSDSTAVRIADGLNLGGNLVFAGGATVNTILDEDTMASDSNTALATQQSIKAYVDAEVAASNTLTIADDTSTTIAINLDNTLTVTGGDSLTTSVSGSAVTISLDDDITVNQIGAKDSTAVSITSPLQSTSIQASGSITAGSSFIIGSADINETDLEKLDGITDGTAAANKALVLDGSSNISGVNQLSTTTLDVNVIQSTDSTEILINEALRVSGTITGTVTEAQYADLAERYIADKDYSEGHVLIFGGDAETTESTQENDTRIAGVVSTNYAFLMNKDGQGPAVALKGKVPCKVVGSVRKGDLMITSSTPGHAVASNNPNPLSVIGRSIEDDPSTHPRLINIVV